MASHRSNTEPFIYDGEVVRYNTKRCSVPATAPFLIGAKDTRETFGQLLYRPLTGHLLVGRRNRIESAEGLDGEDTAIIAGSRNIISGGVGNTLLSCRHLVLTRSRYSVVAGVTGTSMIPMVLDRLDHALVSTNSFALKTSVVGSSSTDLLKPIILPGFITGTPKEIKPILAVQGDAMATGNLRLQDSLYAKDVFATGSPSPVDGSYPGGTVWCARLIAQEVVTGSVISSRATQLVDGDLTLSGASILSDTLCAAPLSANITITLSGTAFRNGTTLIIKDVTQMFQVNTSFNIFVRVTDGAYIEYQSPSGLAQSQDGIYRLGTTGGCVTFKFISALLPGGHSTWSIVSEFMGRPRLLTVSSACGR